MEKYDVYKDISARTGGDVYIGVVGPVRTGKSTFITKFMETTVIPNISGKLQKQIATDEMPQSAGGKTVMTTQPKFVPSDAVKVSFKNRTNANVRLVDSVGFLVDGATGHEEDDKPRMVKTPWDKDEIPFEKAAEIGTKKVIEDYSTIGVIVTTDGSFGEIPRESFVKAEEKAVKELKKLNKPFIIILNSANPSSDTTNKLCDELEEKYGVAVVCKNVAELTFSDVGDIMEKVLLEFPMEGFDVDLPDWLRVLPADNPMISELLDELKKSSDSVLKMRDFPLIGGALEESEYFETPTVKELSPAVGFATYSVKPKEGLFYKVLSEECGEELENDYKLLKYIKTFSASKKEYTVFKDALKDAKEKGYGIVAPITEMTDIEDPVPVKQGGKYGIKLKAKAPSFHILRVDVETEIAPIVGTEKQSGDLLGYVSKQFEENPQEIWKTNMFGKSLADMVNDGLSAKTTNMPEEAQTKIRKTLTKIVNENKGGIICILL